MTYTEAIKRTEDAERRAAERGHAKYRLMRAVYRRVCKKIDCIFCPICNTCHFKEARGRGYTFREAVKLCMRDEDVVTVSKWSRDEASKEGKDE